jgi:RNA polymerase sigma-70 factor, ECF subfamily
VKQDDDPLSRMVEAHGPLVWRTTCRLLRGDDGVEDCFQETFLEFIRHANNAPVEQPAGLLLRIATRRAIDQIRRRSRRRAAERSLAEGDAAFHVEPSVAVVGQELAEALRRALVVLPEQQSAVFVMTQLEQMSHAEVAAALGVSLNHVAVLLFRARAALQAKLKGLVPDEGRPS